MKRVYSIDYIKFLAICLVLMYHAGVGSCELLRPFLSVCVPLFFVASGFLRANKIYTMSFVVKNVLRILGVFCIWGILSTVYVYILNNDNFTIKSLIFDTLRMRLGYSNHLWFLFTFGILVISHLFIQRNSIRELIFLCFITFICIFVPSGIWDIVPFHFFCGWESYALTYYLCGMIIRKCNIFPKGWKLYFLFFSFLIFYLCQYIFNSYIGSGIFAKYLHIYGGYDVIFYGYRTFFVFLMTLSLFLLICSLKLQRIRLVEYISNNVFGIYILHEFFLKPMILMEYSVVIRFVVTLLLSLFFVYLFGKVKILKSLISI